MSFDSAVRKLGLPDAGGLQWPGGEICGRMAHAWGFSSMQDTPASGKGKLGIHHVCSLPEKLATSALRPILPVPRMSCNIRVRSR